ncbi:MAG: SNF2 helicase associated domain-containing protein [Polyangiaceae bacterium]|nr:SNF2 helicase associated domain-containing protein [Polyangiaceae bacterium]MCW5790867.1 SNF2 helicase associated domain-containing protein [Polyangiaceae bacterium]
MTQPPLSRLSDSLSTLSDRGLRKLLGARTFLRGLEYEKRRSVEQVGVGDVQATGRVKGSDPEPYEVEISLTDDGIQATCTCPAFKKTGQNCKHIAALLINVRNQARAKLPRREQPAPTPPAPPAASAPNGESKASRRRDRRRRAQLQATGGIELESASTEAAARSTGIGAWLTPKGATRTLELEYRLHVRQGGLTVTVLDTEARQPLLPSVALAWQAVSPTPDRQALRVLSRFESGNPRHPAVDIRGEDVADLLPLLRDRRVLLEPALMRLRFADEELRPRFDLELVGSETIVAKATFERVGDTRRFSLSSGGWFEGSPGWHIETGDGVARPLDRKVSPAALRRLLKTTTIAEPAGELISLITSGLPRVALEVGAELPDLSQVAEVIDLEPTFRLRAGGSITEAHASLKAEYDDLEVEVRADGISPPVLILPALEGQKRARCIRCDIVAQQAAVQRLLDLGFKADETGESFIAEGAAAIDFWSHGADELPRDWDLFLPTELAGTRVRGKPVQMSARVSSGMDWLNVNISYESEGIGVDRDELRRCLAEGLKYVRLTDNTYAPFDPERVKQLIDREVELLAAAGKNGKIPLSHAGRIQELLEHTDNATVAAATKQLFKKLASIDSIKAMKKPRGLKATLRPYQEQGLSWLRFVHDLGAGGVLADDMGLGKTIQTIALMLSLKNEQKALRALIVAPTSVVSNWVREIERFAPGLTTALWHGAGRREQKAELGTANVIITSYALLRRDIDLLKKLELDYAILDEAQNIKNPLSATAQAAKELGARHRLALTGTPIENRLSEIWSIFEFVNPGLLGPLTKFEERFARPIDQGDSKKAARLRAVIHPFILRRTKIEVVKDLPPKIETDQIVDLAPDQRAIYTQVLREVRSQVMGEVERVGVAKSQLHILAGLTRLRQAACDPRLLGLPREFSHEDSGKLMALRELVSECESGGHKVLVFSQFVSMLKLIKKALDEDKINYEYLDGSTTDRPERIDRFQEDPTVTCFLISLKAGGSGLNLTAADTVIHFDPWWNPAVEDQASDRAHRIGQSKVVSVYRLVAGGTIEEKILQLKQKKKDLVASVLTEDAGGAKKLTQEDLEDLFRLE